MLGECINPLFPHVFRPTLAQPEFPRPFRQKQIPSSFPLKMLLTNSSGCASSFEGQALNLPYLTELSDVAAESLSKHKGELCLNGLTELSDAAAESLSKHQFGGHLKKGHCGEDFSVIYAQHLALLSASFPI